MQHAKQDYKTRSTDWALTIGAAVATAIVCALLYAPPAHWQALLR